MKNFRQSSLGVLSILLLLSFTAAVTGDDTPTTTDGELPKPGAAPASSDMTVNVTFDEAKPGVAYVEVNGERLRIDTASRTVARVKGSDANAKPANAVVIAPEVFASPAKEPRTPPEVFATTDSNPAASPAVNAQSEPATARPTSAYDYQLINLPTPKRVAKGALNVHFSHRFSTTITGQGQDFDDVASNLFGLDSFAVSSLGFTYGFTNRLYGKIYRSPICDNVALCKTIEMGAGFHLLDEAGKSPVALSVYGSIEGNDNFSDNFTYNAQVMLARSITEHINVFFAPAVHFKTNGNGRFNPRPGRFFNDAEIARNFRLGEHTGSFGFGVNGRITQGTSLLFEYVPRTGFKLGRIEPQFDDAFNFIGYRNRSFPSIGFGIEKRLGRHAFALTFSNTQTTTTSRYNASNLALPRDRFVIGFNLYRRLR